MPSAGAGCPGGVRQGNLKLHLVPPAAGGLRAGGLRPSHLADGQQEQPEPQGLVTSMGEILHEMLSVPVCSAESYG